MLLLPVVGIFLSNFRHLRLHELHLAHGDVGLVGQREEDQLDDNGDDQDGDTEVAEQVEEPVDREEHRFGEEVEPAPVDEEFEPFDAERFLVTVENLGFLGAGKQIRAAFAGRTACNGHTVAEIVGLEDVGGGGVAEARLEFLTGVGISVAAQYLSVMPSRDSRPGRRRWWRSG